MHVGFTPVLETRRSLSPQCTLCMPQPRTYDLTDSLRPDTDLLINVSQRQVRHRI